jgi:hypothetical protein
MRGTTSARISEQMMTFCNGPRLETAQAGRKLGGESSSVSSRSMVTNASNGPIRKAKPASIASRVITSPQSSAASASNSRPSMSPDPSWSMSRTNSLTTARVGGTAVHTYAIIFV